MGFLGESHTQGPTTYTGGAPLAGAPDPAVTTPAPLPAAPMPAPGYGARPSVGYRPTQKSLGGIGSTILTSGAGLTTRAETAKKTLLGQ